MYAHISNNLFLISTRNFNNSTFIHDSVTFSDLIFYTNFVLTMTLNRPIFTNRGVMWRRLKRDGRKLTCGDLKAPTDLELDDRYR